MSLIDLAYPQEGLKEALIQSGLPLNGTIVLPWTGDQLLITDSTGNAIGFAFENQMGGMNITNEHMGIEAVTIPNSMGGQAILDQSYNQEAFTIGNPFGGENVYANDFSLEGISFETPLGETLYSSDMQVLGMTQEHQNALQFSFPEFPVDAPAFHSLTDYASTSFSGAGDFAALTGASMDFNYTFIEESLGIFDWL